MTIQRNITKVSLNIRRSPSTMQTPLCQGVLYLKQGRHRKDRVTCWAAQQRIRGKQRHPGAGWVTRNWRVGGLHTVRQESPSATRASHYTARQSQGNAQTSGWAQARGIAYGAKETEHLDFSQAILLLPV